LFSFKVYKLTALIIKISIEKKDSYTLIILPNSKKAFSFFNYIFLGADTNELEKEKIISHELIHCKQKHSLDLLFFESLKILMWFNPLLYIYQKRISTVHEYISDAIILKSADKKRIIMLFKINKEGAITGIRAKAPHPALQEEAVRIIKLLPIMKPGELSGKKVTVKYALPMNIEV
jgi:beta-lactamase regulating signal transducer with metallopeptidase domain